MALNELKISRIFYDKLIKTRYDLEGQELKYSLTTEAVLYFLRKKGFNNIYICKY
jgi:hypothetical protein